MIITIFNTLVIAAYLSLFSFVLCRYWNRNKMPKMLDEPKYKTFIKHSVRRIKRAKLTYHILAKPDKDIDRLNKQLRDSNAGCALNYKRCADCHKAVLTRTGIVAFCDCGNRIQ